LDGLTDEAARAAKAEGHLSDRIDSLVAEGGYDDTDVRAAITRVEEAYVKADAGIAQRIDNVQTSLDGVDSAIDAKAREVTIAYTQADKALADRAETLEASAKSINTALNGPDGVQARLSSYGSTLADLPNRYAAASDVATLLSQVNFATDSGLLRTVTSRIEDRATAIADAKAGAVAETYRGITADLNGRVGKVEERTGAIAGIDGRTTVYWEVLGTTGDDKTRVRLSKSNGERGVFYVDADMVVDGNLLVAGSVTTKTIAANNITQPLSAQTTTVKQISWQDANPNYGVEVTVANPIGAPIRIDFRYSQQGGGQGGQPPFTVQIQRVSPNGDTYNFSDASYIGGIILDTSPPAGAYVTYRFYFKHQYASGQGTTNVIYQQLFALEMRR
jgi:Arc/MetJ-type ribon-helix-helix transcriptional regulator